MGSKHRTLALWSMLCIAGVLVSLTGCQSPDGVFPPFPVLSDGAHNAVQVQVAQDAAGNRHIIWEEEDPAKEEQADSRISYALIRLGSAPHILSMNPPAGYKEYLNPSFGVAGDQLWMVWQRRADSGRITHCYAHFASNARGAPDCQPLDDLPGSEWEPPALVSDGVRVFAAWVGTNEGLKELRIRDLNASIIYIVQYAATADRITGIALDINDDGHLVGASSRLITGTGNDDFLVTKFRVVGSGPDAGAKNVSGISYPNVQISQPALAVDHENDRVYLAYTVNQSNIYLLDYAADLASGDFNGFILPEGSWTIVGAPDLAVSFTGVVVFKGRNGSQGTDHDPWYVTYNRSATPRVYAPGILANNDWEDSVPKITGFIDGDPDALGWLVMWRKNQGAGIYGDVYYSFTGTTGKQIFDSPDTNVQTSYNLATPQTSMATGAWIDQASAADTRLVPWVSYNAYNVSIPVITR